MESFAELFRELSDRILRYVRGRIGSLEDAEDITQDVLVALLSRWELGAPIENAVAWVFQAAHNKVVDWYRRRSRAPLTIGQEDPELNATALWELADADVAGPEEESERQEMRRAILAALSELPPGQREAFLLNEVEGLTFKEMQALTGVPLNTLLARKRYAILKLRKKLAQAFEDYEEK